MLDTVGVKCPEAVRLSGEGKAKLNIITANIQLNTSWVRWYCNRADCGRFHMTEFIVPKNK